jgi:hypothetical protein
MPPSRKRFGSDGNPTMKLKKQKGAGPLPSDAGIMPLGVGIMMIGVLCLPDGVTWSNPIMPDGFITYTDLMPSSGSDT